MLRRSSLRSTEGREQVAGEIRVSSSWVARQGFKTRALECDDYGTNLDSILSAGLEYRKEGPLEI